MIQELRLQLKRQKKFIVFDCLPEWFISPFRERTPIFVVVFLEPFFLRFWVFSNSNSGTNIQMFKQISDAFLSNHLNFEVRATATEQTIQSFALGYKYSYRDRDQHRRIVNISVHIQYCDF